MPSSDVVICGLFKFSQSERFCEVCAGKFVERCIAIDGNVFEDAIRAVAFAASGSLSIRLNRPGMSSCNRGCRFVTINRVGLLDRSTPRLIASELPRYSYDALVGTTGLKLLSASAANPFSGAMIGPVANFCG